MAVTSEHGATGEPSAVRVRTRRFQRARQAGGLRNSRLETCAACRAFSLLEILVAVGLLSVIIIGLLAMFYQTDKAFRLGTRQVDVLESGRAVMELLVRELQEISGGNNFEVVNLYAATSVPPLIQNRTGMPQVNDLQDYYFLVQSNGIWTGIGYYLDPIDPVTHGGVATLYRFSTNYPGMIPSTLTNLYGDYQKALKTAPTNWHRVADNIIHLRLVPYDADGIVYPFGLLTGTYFMTNLTVLKYGFPFAYPSNSVSSTIGTTNQIENMPASVDLEVAILEPRALERYRSIGNAAKALEYLTNSADKVHVFRQRIPIRTRQ